MGTNGHYLGLAQNVTVTNEDGSNGEVNNLLKCVVEGHYRVFPFSSLARFLSGVGPADSIIRGEESRRFGPVRKV
jgi:hypothetical protein